MPATRQSTYSLQVVPAKTSRKSESLKTCTSTSCSNTLYVWTAPTATQKAGKLDSYGYTIGTSLAGAGVTTATVNLSKRGKPIIAVFKQSKPFRHKGTPESALQTVMNLVEQKQSSAFLEQQLHSFLAKAVPDGVVPLVFPLCNQFAYIDKGKTVVPLKVSYYYAAERGSDRALVKQANETRKSVEKRIESAILSYYDSKSDERTRDQDWKNNRNAIYSGGRYLFHDFDKSI